MWLILYSVFNTLMHDLCTYFLMLHCTGTSDCICCLAQRFYIILYRTNYSKFLSAARCYMIVHFMQVVSKKICTAVKRYSYYSVM